VKVVKKHVARLIAGVHNDSKKEVKYFRNCTSCFGVLATTKI